MSANTLTMWWQGARPSISRAAFWVSVAVRGRPAPISLIVATYPDPRHSDYGVFVGSSSILALMLAGITRFTLGRRSRWIVIGVWVTLAIGLGWLQPKLQTKAADE